MIMRGQQGKDVTNSDSISFFETSEVRQLGDQSTFDARLEMLEIDVQIDQVGENAWHGAVQ